MLAHSVPLLPVGYFLLMCPSGATMLIFFFNIVFFLIDGKVEKMVEWKDVMFVCLKVSRNGIKSSSGHLKDFF